MKITIILRSVALLAACTAGMWAQKPLFTEDFESGKLDPAVWDQRVSGTATIGVEEVDGAHGKYALHARYPNTERNGYAFIVNTHVPDALRTHYFGRAYMKITPSAGMGHDPLIFSGEPGYQLSKFLEIGVYRGVWQPSYQENKSLANQGRGEATVHSETGPPADKWYLLEWEFNDNPDSITMWVDGQQVITPINGEKADIVHFAWTRGNVLKTSDLTGGGFKEIGFGARVWGAPAQTIDVYYDDIAISGSRIGPVK